MGTRLFKIISSIVVITVLFLVLSSEVGIAATWDCWSSGAACDPSIGTIHGQTCNGSEGMSIGNCAGPGDRSAGFYQEDCYCSY